MFRSFVIVFLLSPFALSQVRVSMLGTDFKSHEQIDVKITNGEYPGSNTALEGEDASPASPNDHKPGPIRCCRSVLRIG